jgi:flagellar biosynthesis/type III secretory pathway chaperone
MKSLITALDQQLTLMKELHGLLKRETNELSDVNVAAMAEINAAKEDVSLRMQAHGIVLRAAIQAVASSEGLSANATLGDLVAVANKSGNRDIARSHSQLNELAGQIKELLSLNREIAEKFASSVGSSLEFISRIINQTSTYGASGSYQQRPAGSVLINREA